jgi:histone H3/H4
VFEPWQLDLVTKTKSLKSLDELPYTKTENIPIGYRILGLEETIQKNDICYSKEMARSKPPEWIAVANEIYWGITVGDACFWRGWVEGYARPVEVFVGRLLSAFMEQEKMEPEKLTDRISYHNDALQEIESVAEAIKKDIIDAVKRFCLEDNRGQVTRADVIKAVRECGLGGYLSRQN